MAATGICSIDGCGKRNKARGLCAAHWQRWRKYGAPTGGRTNGMPLAFLNEAAKCVGGECFIWPFAKTTRGYGQIRRNGKAHSVSRLVCEMVNGPPPSSEHEAAHTCGKGSSGCVSGAHLVWKTHTDNMMDRHIHGSVPHGETAPWAKLTNLDVLAIRAAASSASQTDIARAYGLTQSMVSLIVRRKRWAHL